MCFEELGPTFIKLGQVLATRPDLIPNEYIEEFKKLQDQVPAVPFTSILPFLEEQYPEGVEHTFAWIEDRPVGSASIAQVHRAQLKTGEMVVLKVQKPGVAQIIQEDLEILRWALRTIAPSIESWSLFDLNEIVDEFASAMEAETQFIIEGNSIRRFYENFQGQESIRIPKPYLDLSGDKILVLEYISGQTLSEFKSKASKADLVGLMKKGLNAYFAMVFRDGLFHGDLHAGNIIVIDKDHLAFVDFGMVGRLSRRMQNAMANMFIALANEDYERLAEEYMDLSTSPTSSTHVAQFSRELQKLLSPFIGASLKKINIGRLLMESAQLATKYQIRLPSELLIFFKSLVTIDGLGRMVHDDFDLMPFLYDFSSEMVKLKYDPSKVVADLGTFSREITSLLQVLPLTLRSHLKRMNHEKNTQSFEWKDLNVFLEQQSKSRKSLSSAIIAASLFISGAVLSLSPAEGASLVISWGFFALGFLIVLRDLFR